MSEQQQLTREQALRDAMVRRGFKFTERETNWWTPEDIRIRDQAHAEVDADPAWRQQAPSPTSDIALPAPTDIAQARRLLSAANIERDAAALSASNVASAMHRAEQRVSDLANQLEAFSDLDDDITAHAVREIRDDKDTALPHHLAMRRQDRSRVMDRFDMAKAAQGRLRLDLQVAEAVLRDARERAAQLGVHVIRLALEAKLSGIVEREAQVLAARCELLSFCECWFPIADRDASMSPRINALLTMVPVEPSADPNVKQHFVQVHERLLTDADCEIS
jgi:hypothetical protein